MFVLDLLYLRREYQTISLLASVFSTNSKISVILISKLLLETDLQCFYKYMYLPYYVHRIKEFSVLHHPVVFTTTFVKANKQNDNSLYNFLDNQRCWSEH